MSQHLTVIPTPRARRNTGSALLGEIATERDRLRDIFYPVQPRTPFPALAVTPALPPPLPANRAEPRIDPSCQKAYKPWTPKDMAELQALVDAGVKMLEISRQIGRTPEAIRAKQRLLRQPAPVPLLEPPQIAPPPSVLKPLPAWNPKPLEQRLAEAESFRGEIPDRHLRELKRDILACAERVEIEQCFARADWVGVDGCPPKIAEIQKLVASHFNLNRACLLSSRSIRAVARPRQIAMYLSRLLTTHTLSEIGRMFGGHDHSTVIHAVRKIKDLLEGTNLSESPRPRHDPALAEEIELLRRVLVK